jgi:hypothetical protein
MRHSEDITKLVAEHNGIEGYVDKMFYILSPHLKVFYREEAKEYLTKLSELKAIRPWAIITNSATDTVLRKLNTLNLGFTPRVIGNARKYEFSNDWVGLVPEGVYKGYDWFPARGVQLQRETFYRALLHATQGDIRRVAVVEDVAEFVLWLDFLAENNYRYKDVKTALLLTPTTPEWERKRYTDGSEVRYGSDSLLKIFDWLR